MAMNMKSRLASFAKFGALPTEVRLLIWQHALPAPRIIYICKWWGDDPDDVGIDEEDVPPGGILFPSRLYSALDFALERSCVEARELVASRYKPIARAPKRPHERIWNGFPLIERGVETESAIAWPEDIRVDLSRDILYLDMACASFFQDIFKVPGLDWPRILNETQRLAVTGGAFITERPPEEKASTRGNSMSLYDREFEIFDDVEASTLQSTELIQRFKNVREVILSLCKGCYFPTAAELKIRPCGKGKWEDWGLTPWPLSSLPTSAPAIEPDDRVHVYRDLREVVDNRLVDPRIQLQAFRLRGVVQALKEEKTRGRLGQVEKIWIAEVVTNVTAMEFHHCCRPTGEIYN